MKVALFGAGGLIGGAVLGEALSKGHEVRALARDPSKIAPHPALTVLQGDARGERAAEVLRGASVVVSAIGPRANTRAAAEELLGAARSVLEAMAREGVRRLIFVAGAGVDAPGDQKGALHRSASLAVRLFARHVVVAKQREFELARASGLDWTAVRPVRVVPGPAAGRGYRVSLRRPPGMRIASGDLAAFIARAAEDGSYVRQAPFVAG